MSARLRFGEVVCGNCNFKARGETRCHICGEWWMTRFHPKDQIAAYLKGLRESGSKNYDSERARLLGVCRRCSGKWEDPGEEPPLGSLAHRLWDLRMDGSCRACAAREAMPDEAERHDAERDAVRDRYDLNDYDKRSLDL